MRLHILVEGPSEEAFLKNWLPRLLGPAHSFTIVTHQGKGRLPGKVDKPVDPLRRGLLDQLPAKLRAYGRTLQSDTDRVVVLVDLDDDDCKEILDRLSRMLKKIDPAPEVLFRLAIEETEAFFIGEPSAIKRAFPSAKPGKLKNHAFDSICGTWELLQAVIGDSSEDKVEWAESIGKHLGIRWQGKSNVNKSPSFRKLCEGLKRICGDV